MSGAVETRAPAIAAKPADLRTSVCMSITRTSTVPYSGRGQASQCRRVESRPVAVRQSSQLRSTGGVPPVGIDSSRSARSDRRPVSPPSANGELAESASRTGSHGTTASKARRAESGSGNGDVDVQPADQLPAENIAQGRGHLLVPRQGHDLLVVARRQGVRPGRIDA